MRFTMQKTVWRVAGLLMVFFHTVLALDVPPLPKNMTLSEALYINCLQRTQTQQMLKDYLMVALKSNYKNPGTSLKEGIPLYDKRIRELNDYFLPLLAEHPKEKKMVADALIVWEASKKLLEAPPSKENALILEKNFSQMIHLLGKAKVLAKKSFKAVGMTGGLCRDPLYMSNTYLMKIWGIDLPEYQAVMQKHIAHFQDNIARLKAYPGNNEETKAYIAKSEKAFLFFTFMYNAPRHAIPTLISEKADTIFLYIRTLKKLYSQMPHVGQ